MKSRRLEYGDAQQLAEFQTRIREAATWLNRDIAELIQLLSRLRARRRILFVGQTEHLRGLAKRLWHRHDILSVATPEVACELASMNELDAVVVDDELVGQLRGRWLLEQIRAMRPDIRRVLIAAEGIQDDAMQEHSGLLHKIFIQPVSPERLAEFLEEEPA